MDGFTGLDIGKARSQLQNFNDMAYDGFYKIYNAAQTFLQEIGKNWASPNAVSFSNDFSSKFSSILSDFQTKVYHAINGCNAAGRALANANGASWSDVSCTLSSDCSFGAGCSETLNGATGMVVDNVKTFRDELKANIESGVETVSFMPRAIDFYSTDGSLVSAYSTGIDKIAEAIKSACDEEYNIISGYIDTETNNIMIAKNSAEESMQTAN